MLTFACAAVLCYLSQPPVGDAPGPTIRITHDYFADLNAAAATVPAESRAWPRYHRAAGALREALGAHDLDPIRGPDHPQWPWLVEFVTSHAMAIDEMRRASELPALGYIASDQWESASSDQSQHAAAMSQPRVLDAKLAYIGDGRVMVRSLSADARAALEAGDASRAELDLAAILRVGRHLGEHPMACTEPVRIAIIALWASDAREALSRHGDALSPDVLRRMAADADELAGREAIRVHLDGERLSFLDLVQRCYTDDGTGDGRLGRDGMVELDRACAPEGEPVTPGQFLKFLDSSPTYARQFYDNLASRREVVAEWDRLTQAQWLSDPLWRRAPPSPPDQDRAWKDRFLLVALLLPNLRRLAGMGECATQERDATRAAIALVLFKRERGRYPDALAELLPDYLPALPIDRFTGEPLHYARTDAGVSIYSVGPDRKDNGGQPLDSVVVRKWINEGPAESEGGAAPPPGDWVLWRSTP